MNDTINSLIEVHGGIDGHCNFVCKLVSDHPGNRRGEQVLSIDGMNSMVVNGVFLNFRFHSLQRIRTDGAVDWEFFNVGEGLAREYFLVVANHVKILPNGVKTYVLDSVIYKWNWNLFVPFQCIKTYGAKKWSALSGQLFSNCI